MNEYKAILLVGNTEIDYFTLESETWETAGKATDARFAKAYPVHFNHKDARIEIEEI